VTFRLPSRLLLDQPRRGPGKPADRPGDRANTNTLAAALIGFLLGGLTVSIAAELEDDDPPPSHGSSSHEPDRSSEPGMKMSHSRAAHALRG
jgi:hypothetical protein